MKVVFKVAVLGIPRIVARMEAVPRIGDSVMREQEDGEDGPQRTVRHVTWVLSGDGDYALVVLEPTPEELRGLRPGSEGVDL